MATEKSPMWGCFTTARTAEKSQAWPLGLSPSGESLSLTHFYYHGAQVFEEYSYYDQSETLEARYVYGDEGVDDVKVMMRSESGTLDAYYYYHKNSLGSIVAVTDDNGDLAEQYSYDPYGTVYMKDGNGDDLSASAIKNPYLFTGRNYDEETGKYYYRARHYDPDTGRFMQRDPAGYVDGMSLYEYVSSNSINYIDPNGKGIIRGGWTYLNNKTMITVIGNYAISVAAKAFPWVNGPERINHPGNDNGNVRGRNAVRHCLFSCLVSKAFGEGAAEDLTDLIEWGEATGNYGNELGSPAKWDRTIDEEAQYEIDTEVDELNNEEGRRCAKSNMSCYECCFGRYNSSFLWGYWGIGGSYRKFRIKPPRPVGETTPKPADNPWKDSPAEITFVEWHPDALEFLKPFLDAQLKKQIELSKETALQYVYRDVVCF